MTAAPQATAVWDLDAASASELEAALNTVSAFVEQLRRASVGIPRCWYVHGWVVYRLAALHQAHGEALRQTASARDAVWWWESLEGLRRDMQPLLRHSAMHPPADDPLGEPAPLPTLDEHIAKAVGARRSEQDEPCR